MRTCESCLCFRIREDAVIRVGTFALGGEGQLPRNGDARRWTHNACHVEGDDVAFFGAVDNLLQIVVDFFKDGAVDEPRFSVLGSIPVFGVSRQSTFKT